MTDSLINNLEYTVSELSNSIKRLIEDNFDYVRLKAEIGRVSNLTLVIYILILRMIHQ